MAKLFFLLLLSASSTLLNSLVQSRPQVRETGLIPTNNGKLNITCLNGTSILVKGESVRFSEIGTILSSMAKKKPACWKYAGYMESLKIFATKDVIIDANVDATYKICFQASNKNCLKNTHVKKSGLHLTVFAPTWTITGERVIDVSGYYGRLWSGKVNRSYDGFHGTDGGTFFGIGREFNGGENLKILANGGNGEDGTGAEGKGGKAGGCGNITIIELDKRSKITQENHFGKHGLDAVEKYDKKENLFEEPTFPSTDDYMPFLHSKQISNDDIRNNFLLGFIENVKTNTAAKHFHQNETKLPHTTLNDENLQVECRNEISITVKGESVKFSEIGKTLNSMFKNKTACWKDTGKIESLEIFAAREVIIDTNVDSTYKICFKDSNNSYCLYTHVRQSRFHLTVFAPTWNITGERVIDVSGNYGRLWSGKVNRSYNGFHGTHGGNFFGIGREFIGGKNLKILANGGNGQDGSGSEGKGGKGGFCGNIMVNDFGSESGIIKKQYYGKAGKDAVEKYDLKRNVYEVPKFSIFYEYKNFIWENLIENDQKRTEFLINFVDTMESNAEIVQLFNIKRILEHFNFLEKEYKKSNQRDTVLRLYQSFVDLIKKYTASKSKAMDIQSETVLKYLSTAALTKFYKEMKDSSNCLLVVNMKSYLGSMITEFEKIQNFLKQTRGKEYERSNQRKRKTKFGTLIKKINNEYKTPIQNSITEAQRLVKHSILPEIDIIGNEYSHKTVKSLINEVVNLKKQDESNSAELEQAKNKLTIAIQRQQQCVILQDVTKSLSSVSQVFVDVHKDDETDRFGEPSTIPKSVKVIQKQLTDRVQKDFNRFSIILDDIEKQGRNLFPSSDLYEKVDKSRKWLNEQPKTTYSNVIEMGINEFLEGAEDFHFKFVQRLDNKINITNANKSFELIRASSNLNEEMLKLVEDCKKNTEELDVITEAIIENNKNINLLNNYEKAISGVIYPMLQNILNEINKSFKTLHSKSQVFLDVTKWRLNKDLTDVQDQLQDMTQGFEAESKFKQWFTKLEGEISLLIQIYDRIARYEEQIKLADFFADIGSVIIDSSSSLENPTNESYTELEKKLDNMISYNTVARQYQTAVNSFSQFAFPFAEHYFKELEKLPENEDNYYEYVDKAVKNLDVLKNKVDYNQIFSHSQWLISTRFSDETSAGPFFVWNNNEHKDVIGKLFSGKAVVLKADIMKTNFTEEAIKFSLFDFVFKPNDGEIGGAFKNLIEKFTIIATHLGNSYYRYNNENHIIETPPISFTISVKKEDKDPNMPVTKSKSYKQLINGDFMLSPFALWKLKLEANNKYGFNKLKQYVDKVDIELVGKGYYVKPVSETSQDMDK